MVNFDAARRQALGAHFMPAEDEAQRVAELKAGRVVLEPHGLWQLPTFPTWREKPLNERAWKVRLHSLLWLDPLRRADLLGDDAAAEQWWFLASSWIDANPPDAAPAEAAWDGYTVALRALELACGITVTGEQQWLVNSLAQHKDWLSDPSHVLQGPGQLHQHVGLFVLGAVLEDENTIELAVSRLTEQLAEAYDTQGVNEEGAVGHHLQNYVRWNEALQRLDLEDTPRPELSSWLEGAPRFLAHATSPLGRFARIGDTDGGDPRMADHPLTAFVVSGGTQGEKPETPTAIYDAGYAFLRSGWGEDRPFHEEMYVTATWGRQDKVHGHQDGGSLTYAADGVQWIDDTGRYDYGDSPMRHYMLGREGHNSVVVPGLPYRKETEVRLRCHEDTADWTELQIHDAGYEGATITRRIIHLKARGQLLVIDAVKSEDDRVVEQRWHCGRGVTARKLASGFELSHGTHTHVVTCLQGGDAMDIRRGGENPLAGWSSMGWRKASAVDQLMVRARGKDVSLATQIGPRDDALQDLLTSRLTLETMDLSVEELVPQVLLRPRGDVQRWHHPEDGTGLAVTLDVDTVGLLTASVTGGGPLYAFYLLHPDGSIERSPYSRRASRSFCIEGPAGRRLRVYSRDESGQATPRTIDLA